LKREAESSKLIVTVVRSWKLVAAAGDISGTLRIWKVHSWNPLPSSAVKTIRENSSLCVGGGGREKERSLKCSHKFVNSSINLITSAVTLSCDGIYKSMLFVFGLRDS
jgi:hypothetical protein